MTESAPRSPLAVFLSRLSRWRPTLRQITGGSLTRRIVFLNLLGLVALLYGILYLNQFQAGLIDARVQSLQVQGEILARAIAGTATVESDIISLDTQNDRAADPEDDSMPKERSFFINPPRPRLSCAACCSRHACAPAFMMHRAFCCWIPAFSTLTIRRWKQQKKAAQSVRSILTPAWEFMRSHFASSDLPRYVEHGAAEGKSYPEVAQALNAGKPASVVRIDDDQELIVSVAMPIQRQGQLVGALLLSTLGGDIDAVLRAERMGIFRVFLVAAAVMVLLSLLLASTIAGPLKRLSEAAVRVRHGIRKREQIPDFTNRSDEVGDLSGALRDMTRALYNRIEGIERFAADVAHELKNPLTSLKSAIETLPIVKNDNDRSRLLGIIDDDVQRLDRLITDISAASRLDAELQRQNETLLDLKDMLPALISFYEDMRAEGAASVRLAIKNDKPGAFVLMGHDSRLGQVFSNLIDNALSFSPLHGEVHAVVRAHGR